METNINSAERLLKRAEALVDLKRYDAAEAELRQALAREPDDARAHMWLALTLLGRHDQLKSLRQDRPRQLDKALKEAQAAVSLAPDFAYPYAVLAVVLLALKRDGPALQAIQEALRLTSDFAPFYEVLARIYARKADWPKMLEAAEEGLRLDPADVDCLNLRIMALVMLGRTAEAGQAIETALAHDPNNAFTHANYGWLLLRRDDYQRAMHHFREALRIDPLSEWAQEGIVDAMKARNPLYRPLLRYSLWLSRFSKSRLWAMTYGLSALNRILRVLARAFPPLLIIVVPWFLIYLVFAFFSWTGEALFDLWLRLDPVGRLVLTREKTAASNWVGVCLLAAALSLVVGLVFRNLAFLGASLGALAMMVPVAGIFKLERGRGRNVLTGYAILLGAAGLCSLGSALVNAPWALVPVALFLVGWMLYSWVANVLIAREQ